MSRYLDLIYTVVDQLNSELPEGAKISKAPDAPLLEAGGVDSLTLVNLVVGVEQLVFDETGTTLALADETLLSTTDNPFRSIAALAKHLEAHLP